MATKVLLFGQLVEMVGKNTLEMEDVKDTETLQKKLHTNYPTLARAIYCIAVDKYVVTKNTTLTEETIVALLPQYAGG